MFFNEQNTGVLARRAVRVCVECAMEEFADITEIDVGLAGLARAAASAADSAHAPFSRFRVGAALLLDDGTVVTGANYESDSYGLTMCAERVAVFRANMEGARERVRAAAVFGRSAEGGPDEPVMPCGACRQILAELAAACGRPDMPVVCADARLRRVRLITVAELLPHPFIGGV
ncbi:MAG: cytidine deaminase [Opitutales bacterium]|nr:cytidine deaminase [Opitutales bacterium]